MNLLLGAGIVVAMVVYFGFVISLATRGPDANRKNHAHHG